MILLAIDLYGIEPFQKPIRIPLKPGFNLLTGPNGGGKSAIRRLFGALLLNAPIEGLSFVNGQGQAAVILQADDGAAYRIAADFIKGGFSLSKLDAAGKGTLIEKERGKIVAWIRREARGLEEEALSSLFLIDRSAFSPGPRKEIDPAAPPPPPIAPSPTPSPSSEAQMEKEKALREAEQRLEALSRYETEALDLNDKASALRRRIDQSRDLTARLERLQEVERSKFAAIAEVGQIPPDLLPRYEEGLRAKQGELERLTEEREEVEASLRLSGGEDDPLRDRSIQIGIGLTVLSFLLPVFVTLRGFLRYLFLVGALAGIGLSIFSYFKLTQRVAQRSGLEKKRSHLNDRLFQLDKKFDKEHKGAIDLLKKTGLKEVSDVKELQRAYQNHLQNKKELSDQRETLLQGETIERLENQREECAKKAQALEENLRGYEGLNQEVYRLREELRREEPAESPGAEVFPSATLPSLDAAARPGASSLSNALSVGRRHNIPLPLDQIQKQANILYALFAPARAGEIHLKETGEITLGESGVERPEAERPIDRLSSGTSEQILFSALLAALDRFETVPFPLILDDPFVSLDPKRRETALELLRGISKKRQVILLTAHPSQPNAADHRVQLGAG